MPRLTSEEMAKLYEERAKEYREKAIVTRVSKGGWEYSKKAKEAEAMTEYYRSKQFYAEHGHPEYAGKYEAPEVPEGYKVKAITETKEGLQISFISTAPKGIAQTIYDIQLPHQAEYEIVQSQLAKAGLPAKPPAQKQLGAFLAPFESAFYGIGGLVGGVVKTVQTGKPQLTYGWEWAGLETPVIPATLSGGLVSSAVQSVLAGKPVETKELKEWKALTHGEKMAGLLGEITLAWLIGKAVTKVTHVIAKPVQTKAESWLTKRYLGKVPSGGFVKETMEPFTSKLAFVKPSVTYDIPIKSWAGLSEKFVMRVTGAKPYLPSGVVSYPSPATVGLKGLKAQQLAWELSLTPRTSLVTVTKVGAKRTVYRFFRGVGYTPMSVTLAKAMSVKDMGGRQAILQIEKPTKGVMPYLPKIETDVAPKISSMLPTSFGVGLTLGVKAVPKPKRISKQKRKAIPILTPKLTLYEEPSEIMKEREKVVLLPKLRQPSISEVAVIQKTITVQKQIQQPVQIQILKSPLKSIGKPPKLWRPRLLKTGRKRKKKKKLKGEWWLKTWPVKRSVFLPEEFELKMEL